MSGKTDTSFDAAAANKLQKHRKLNGLGDEVKAVSIAKDGAIKDDIARN
jgi:hypothetical protein